MKKRLIKIIIPTALLFVIFSLSSLQAKGITIKAGTPVPVRLQEAVSSETATAGQIVRFTVTRDVKVDDVIVIKAGSEVTGEVTYSQKTGSLGKEGKLFLVIKYATAVDETRVPLRANLSQTGEENVAVSIIVCPFIKGTASMMNAGTEAKAYVDYNTKVNVD